MSLEYISHCKCLRSHSFPLPTLTAIRSLSWAFLQERITTTPYEAATGKTETYDFPIFTNTVQSASAFFVGYLYLLASSDSERPAPSLFPTNTIIPPLVLVSLTGTLASPFGYASLKHVGYLTFILAKSCKLVPVMALQVTIFRRKYPFYKYAVVALVTAGVAVFTLKTDSKKIASSKRRDITGNAPWGLLLLSINLLFDGLTNSTQDHINTKFAPYSGMQMMPAQNLIQTVLGGMFLLLAPLLSALPVLDNYMTTASGYELSNALAFIQRHPAVGNDLFGFALCGAIGQCFIFYTLARFSSLVLVTVTVTRKMLTMLLSVLWFGHTLSSGQWTGVGLVFGGVAAEAILGSHQQKKKTKRKRSHPE